MPGDADGDAVGGCSQDLRTKRRQARQFIKHGITLPGFEPISPISHAFVKSLIDLAARGSDPDDVSVNIIAAFLTRAMVPYSRVIAFAVQPDDPREFRTAMADGLQRTPGFSDAEISGEMLLVVLEDLVDNIDLNAQDLAKPFAMLHRLVTDLVETRRDNPQRERLTERDLQRRRSELQDGEYWNSVAGSLSQFLTWLNQNPDFIDSATVPPFSYADNVYIMALESLGPDVDPDLRHLRLWKEIHQPLVSRAINQQRATMQPRDGNAHDAHDSDDPHGSRDPHGAQDAGPTAKSKKARPGKKQRQKTRTMAEAEASPAAAHDPDVPIPSIENGEALRPSPASSEGSGRTYHGGSDFDEDQRQGAMGLSPEQLVDGSSDQRLKYYFDMVVEIIDEKFDTMQVASQRRAQEKLDAFWKLFDIFGSQEDDE